MPLLWAGSPATPGLVRKSSKSFFNHYFCSISGENTLMLSRRFRILFIMFLDRIARIDRIWIQTFFAFILFILSSRLRAPAFFRVYYLTLEGHLSISIWNATYHLCRDLAVSPERFVRRLVKLVKSSNDLKALFTAAELLKVFARSASRMIILAPSFINRL